MYFFSFSFLSSYMTTSILMSKFSCDHFDLSAAESESHLFKVTCCMFFHPFVFHFLDVKTTVLDQPLTFHPKVKSSGYSSSAPRWISFVPYVFLISWFSFFPKQTVTPKSFEIPTMLNALVSQGFCNESSVLGFSITVVPKGWLAIVGANDATI